MRLLVCAVVAGCGGLEIYETPAGPSPELPDETVEAPFVSWKGGDDSPDSLPGNWEGIDGPMHLLYVTDAASPLVPAVEDLLGLGDDLVIRLDMIDPPIIEARVAALLPSGAQDYCLPTLDVVGAFDGRDFRFVLPGHDFQATPLPWGQVVLEGALVAGALVDVMLYVEVPIDRIPMVNPCGELGCRGCTGAQGTQSDLCAHVPLQPDSEPLVGLVLEPMTLGDAEAACR